MTRRRLLLGIAAFLIGVAVAAIVGAFVLFPPWMRDRIVEEAKQRGVTLQVGEVTLGFGRATVKDAKFRLIGVQGLVGSAEVLDVRLDFLTIKGVEASGVKLETAGSAPLLALEISTWARTYPRTLKLPAVARDVHFTWRERVADEPWLVVSGGEIAPQPGGAVFRASDVRFSGIALGKVGAAWTGGDVDAALAFGEDDIARAPVRIKIEHARQPARATIELSPVPLDQLSAPFGTKLPLKNVKASGTVVLELEAGGEPRPVTGTLSATLHGYIPPHPRELDGIVFGDRTTFDTKLRVNPERSRVELTESKVKAGAFQLGGGGVIKREETHATISLELRGNLACTTLAGAAAETHLGQTLGKIAGAIAKQTLKGSVGILVKVLADTRELDKAKVLETIGIGCGLKPLSIPNLDFSGFELPPEVQKTLPKELPKLPSGGGVPSLPSGLPSLPLPKIDVDFGKPKPKPEPTTTPTSEKPAPATSG